MRLRSSCPYKFLSGACRLSTSANYPSTGLGLNYEIWLSITTIDVSVGYVVLERQ